MFFDFSVFCMKAKNCDHIKRFGSQHERNVHNILPFEHNVNGFEHNKKNVVHIKMHF